jgi:hypothetical protein
MTRLLAGLLLASACGGHGSATDKFIGTWQPSGGTFTLACPGGTTANPVTDLRSIARGTSSDLVMLVGGGCPTLFDVSGDVATVRPGQPCMVSGPGETDTFFHDAWTFTTHDGRTATETATGSDAVVTPAGPSTCTFTESATLVRVSMM